jgi:hypothetical protein
MPTLTSSYKRNLLNGTLLQESFKQTVQYNTAYLSLLRNVRLLLPSTCSKNTQRINTFSFLVVIFSKTSAWMHTIVHPSLCGRASLLTWYIWYCGSSLGLQPGTGSHRSDRAKPGPGPTQVPVHHPDWKTGIVLLLFALSSFFVNV